jgi:GNAT superfamily N-acetyltransferase
MQIVRFQPEHVSAAAALFVEGFQGLHQVVPDLPDHWSDPQLAAQQLEGLVAGPGETPCMLAAVEGNRLVGYLGWYLVDGFRNAEVRGAYCPVWGHAAGGPARRSVYSALYREAAAIWSAAGCKVHAISLLAHDREAVRIWFWNGFGLGVVDAIRPITPLDLGSPTGVTVRKAQVEDAGMVADIDSVHWQHYGQPPVLMATHAPDDAGTYRGFLARKQNSVWLAEAGGEAVGFLRFEAESDGATELVQSAETVAITGAFVFPAFRGKGIMPALLDAGLGEFQSRGCVRCAVDFESFNPEASGFWPKYFEPVVFSLMRHPEKVK